MRARAFPPILGLAAAFLTSVGLAVAAPQANADTFTFGKTTDGTWDFPVIANELRVYKHSLTRAGRIDSLSILIRGGSSAQTLKLVLYGADGSGKPGPLLAQTAGFTVAQNQTFGAVTRPLTAPYTAGVGTYFLGWHASTTGGGAIVRYNTTASPQQWVKGAPYPSSPSPLGPPYNIDGDNFVMPVYATVTASDACSDGTDNDGDGKVDFPVDGGCGSASDTNEANPTTGPEDLAGVPSGFTFCAWESATCSFNGTREVVYGAHGAYTAPRQFTGGTSCTNAVFGDPAPGKEKACFSRPPEVGFATGYHYTTMTPTDRQTYATKAVEAGAKWIRFEIDWRYVQPSSANDVPRWDRTDDGVAKAQAAGLKIVLTPFWWPGWANRSTQAYKDFLTKVVNRYKPGGTFGSSVRHWEVWNEPNISYFWQTTDNSNVPNATAYANLFIAASQAIKAADPNAVVLTAGLAPQGAYPNEDNVFTDNNWAFVNPVLFLERCYAVAGFKEAADVIAAHPYAVQDNRTGFPDPLAYGPWNGWSEIEATNPSFRSIMTARGDSAKKIWATEMGFWMRGDGSRTPTEVASYIPRIFDTWFGRTYTGPMFWYTHRDWGTGNTREESYGLLNSDWTKKLEPWNAYHDWITTH